MGDWASLASASGFICQSVTIKEPDAASQSGEVGPATHRKMFRGRVYSEVEESMVRGEGRMTLISARHSPRNSESPHFSLSESGTGKDNHPQPQQDINARTEARPPGWDSRVLNENIMHKIKETVRNDPNSHEHGRNESSDDRDCRKHDRDDQFPD